MPIHHYVPVSVISAFVCPNAWRLVEDRSSHERIARIDAERIARQKRRRFPVVLYKKADHKQTRAEAGHVCCANNLYQIPQQTDPLYRSYVQYDFLGKRNAVKTLEDFNALSRLPIDPEVLERNEIGDLDSAFARILQRLNKGGELTEADRPLILRFITFARYRTPAYRDLHYPDVFSEFQGVYSGLRSIRGQTNPLAASSQEEYDQLKERYYPISIVVSVRDGVSALEEVNAKIILYRRFGQVPFITCDNPARPYRADRIQAIHSSDLPALWEPTTRITYPISPDLCLVISSDLRLPAVSVQRVGEHVVRGINTALAQSAYDQVVFPSLDRNVFQDWMSLDDLQIPQRG